MAVPLEPVVAVCVVCAPLGAVKVKITVAPEAGAPELVTVALIGTAPGAAKFVPVTERLAASEGGVTTVALAVSDAAAPEFEALKFTAYIPAGVPFGAPFPIVTLTD